MIEELKARAERAVMKARMLSNRHICRDLMDPEHFAEKLLDGYCPSGGKCTGLGSLNAEDNTPLECWNAGRCWKSYDRCVGNVRYC